MNMLKGIALMFGFTLAFSLLSALLFRFPVPFAGVVGPLGELQMPSAIETLKGAALAWAAYTAIGLGLPQLLGGALVGALAGRGAASTATIRNRLVLGGAALSLVLVLGLATLDWFIGPW